MVPDNNYLLTGTVPVNNYLLTGTISTSKFRAPDPTKMFTLLVRTLMSKNFASLYEFTLKKQLSLPNDHESDILDKTITSVTATHVMIKSILDTFKSDRM